MTPQIKRTKAPPRLKVKVYFDHDRLVKIGPLGYFRVGDQLTVRGKPRVVVRVDLDGMAIAFDKSVVEMHDEDGKPTRTVADGIERMNAGQPPSGNNLTDPQKRQCRRIAKVGERMRAEREAAAA